MTLASLLVLLDQKAAGFWANTSSLAPATPNCTKMKKLRFYEGCGPFHRALPMTSRTRGGLTDCSDSSPQQAPRHAQ